MEQMEDNNSDLQICPEDPPVPPPVAVKPTMDRESVEKYFDAVEALIEAYEKGCREHPKKQFRKIRNDRLKMKRDLKNFQRLTLDEQETVVAKLYCNRLIQRHVEASARLPEGASTVYKGKKREAAVTKMCKYFEDLDNLVESAKTMTDSEDFDEKFAKLHEKYTGKDIARRANESSS